MMTASKMERDSKIRMNSGMKMTYKIMTTHKMNWSALNISDFLYFLNTAHCAKFCIEYQTFEYLFVLQYSVLLNRFNMRQVRQSIIWRRKGTQNAAKTKKGHLKKSYYTSGCISPKL